MAAKNEGRYLPASQLLAMRRAGKTLRQIIEANYEATGFRPDPGNLSRQLTALGAEGRRVPLLLRHWTILPEHMNSRWRRMLDAKSKELEGGWTLNEKEQRAVSLLEFLLRPGRGKEYVVTYHQQIGFCLVDARPGEAYIRVPDDSAESGLELVK